MHQPHPDPERRTHSRHAAKGNGHYLKLAAMMALSFVAMYGLMYAMVDRLDHVYHNVNQVWMAGLMVAPMLVIELVLMWRMYPNAKLNVLLLAIGLVAGCVFWTLIRQQAAVGERQFYRSMIPHHAGAILMCEQRKTENADVAALCARILASQRAEIAQMRSALDEDER